MSETAPMPPVVIGEVALNASDVLRVSLDSFMGRPIIDARKFYRRDDGTAGPTRKGLTLGIDRLPALAELVTAALLRARADGPLPNSEGRE